MKKLILTILLVSLVCSLAMTGHAAQTDAVLTDAVAQPGDTVYMTLLLPEGSRGDAVGITYTYDAGVLERLPEESVWCRKGVLKDFSIARNEGVWAAAGATDLSGDCCILAFRVRESGQFTQTQVSCTVIVKSGADQTGSFTASGTVSTHCDHSYGSWQSGGQSGHIQTCEKCGKNLTAAHQWDEGKKTTDPNDDAVTVFTITCTDCGETRVETFRTDVHVVTPTFPAETEPEETLPETIPLITEESPAPFFPDKEENKGHKTDKTDKTDQADKKDKEDSQEKRPDSSKETRPGSPDKIPAESKNPATVKPANTKPQKEPDTTEKQLTDYNAPKPTEAPEENKRPTGNVAKTPSGTQKEDINRQEHAEHADDHPGGTQPMAIPQNKDYVAATTETVREEHADHDHTQKSAEINYLSVITAVSTTVVLIAVLMFFLRKKRR